MELRPDVFIHSIPQPRCALNLMLLANEKDNLETEDIVQQLRNHPTATPTVSVTLRRSQRQLKMTAPIMPTECKKSFNFQTLLIKIFVFLKSFSMTAQNQECIEELLQSHRTAQTTVGIIRSFLPLCHLILKKKCKEGSWTPYTIPFALDFVR